MCGMGTYTWKNGDIYTGQWKNDLQNGHGKLTKKGGDVFDGTFKDGKPDGPIIIHYANGSK